MKNLFFNIFLLGFSIQTFAQITVLPEVDISVNYKYLDAVNTSDDAESVKMLHEKVAFYDLKNSELYSDEYDNYYVTFYVPEGKILAAYNSEGEIIRTIEKFKNIKLPQGAKESVSQRFPGWIMEKDVYRVSYNTSRDGTTKEQYQIKLKNGDETIRVKVDPNGNFL